MNDTTQPISRLITHRGVTIPSFLYGTAWKEEQTETLTYNAIKAGFLGIDTANQRRHYYEAGVGNAVKRAIDERRLQRAELFLQSKFTFISSQDQRLPYDPNADYRTQVRQSFASSLEHLHTDYLDSYVLHGPSTGLGLGDADWAVWQAMEDLQQAGVVKLLGVSNVNFGQLQMLIAQADVKPAFVQNRCYARTQWDAEIRGLCREHDVIYQGFSLLTANATALQSAGMARIAQRLGCTLAQLAFRFALQLGMMPLTGTSSEQHLHADLASYGLELSPSDMDVIERIAL
ncbi:MAG: aldo/keto reductase [Methylovulum sp.]|nr:aldo/keto reductase [Methylovulum sp.]